MASTMLCQPSNTDTNPYLVITIRVLAAVGFSYILGLLYRFVIWPLFSRRSLADRSDAAAEENISIDPDNTAPANRISLELDFGDYDGGDLGIRVPEPAYHPPGRR